MDHAMGKETADMHKTKVLIVDDEPAIREVLEMILQEWGYEVRLASDGAEAKDLVETYDPGIVISDVVMPQLSGLDLLRCLKAGNPNRPVILITAHASVDLAVESMKQGAQDFITKPMDYPKLRAILKAAESDNEMRQTSRKLNSQLERGSGFGEFVGVSKPMRDVYDLIQSLSGKQEFEFDVRVIAATNQDPRTAIADGKLREDLYYRLTVFTVHLPPLRDRKEDVPLLAQHFISEFNRKHNVNVEALRNDALEMLMTYSWPGNVREFRNVLERALILARGEWIETSHLPPYLRNPSAESSTKIVLPLGITAAEAERELILKNFAKSGHNKAEDARQLGLDVKTIRNKLKTYKIEE